MAPLLIEPESKLVPTKSRGYILPTVWLNLACLDAPIVAVTWQWLFARSFHLSLSIPIRAALFVTAWLIYLVDRLADTWSLSANGPLSLRQQFCQRHQNTWFVAIAGLALLDLWIILRQLDGATIRAGILIGAPALVYLAANYWLGKIWRIVPVKELCVGSLFAIGTVAALPRMDFSTNFAVSFLLFASLCSLNCISIAIWERNLDRAQGKHSIATCRWGIGVWLRSSEVAITILAVALAMTSQDLAPLYVCIGASALFLAILDWLGDRISRDERTAMADLVLLTPLFLFALRMFAT